MAKKQAKVGQLVKVTGNSNSNDYTIGEIYRVTRNTGSNCVQAESLDGNWTGNNLDLRDCEIVGLTKEHFKSEIKRLENEIAEAKSIMAWMDETGNTEYNADEHKVWTAITTIEDNSISKLDKVKLIASLLK